MTHNEAETLEPILENIVKVLNCSYYEGRHKIVGVNARYVLNMIDEAFGRFRHELEMVHAIANNRPIAEEIDTVCFRASFCPKLKTGK